MLLGQIVHAQVSGSWELDAKMTAQALAIEKCPPRIVVAKFKHGWTKNIWGPPTNIDFDVLKTN